MLSGYSRKIDSNVSALTIDARKILRNLEEHQQKETEEDIPKLLQIKIKKGYASEFGIRYDMWSRAQQNDIMTVESTIISDELRERYPSLLPYNRMKILKPDVNYSLNSEFVIEEDEILIFQQNTLVLNAHELRIKGGVLLHGKSTICNGVIVIETSDGSRDVFTTREIILNQEPLIIQKPEIQFNAVLIRTIDDGSSITFLSQIMGFPKTEEECLNQEELTGFKILYNYCFTEDGSLYQHLNTIPNWNMKRFFISLFLHPENTPDATIEKIMKNIQILIEINPEREIIKDFILKVNENGVTEPTDIVRKIIDFIFMDSNKNYFKSISENLALLKGKVSMFNNIISFKHPTKFKMSYSAYIDLLRYNIRFNANDVGHIYGYHDFITDDSVNSNEKKSDVNIERCTFTTIAEFMTGNHGPILFDLNGELNVKSTEFKLIGACEFASNNFIEDEKVKVYHTKTFEDCVIEMSKSDNFLTINGGNAIFRNCKIHFHEPVLETSRFITFRRYPNKFEKKIRVYFENCEILGESCIGDDETFNEDYCKIVIRPSKNNLRQAELYINSDDIIKNQYEKEFTDIDELAYYSGEEKKCYIRGRQMNPFENGILIEE